MSCSLCQLRREKRLCLALTSRLIFQWPKVSQWNQCCAFPGTRSEIWRGIIRNPLLHAVTVHTWLHRWMEDEGVIFGRDSKGNSRTSWCPLKQWVKWHHLLMPWSLVVRKWNPQQWFTYQTWQIRSMNCWDNTPGNVSDVNDHSDYTYTQRSAGQLTWHEGLIPSDEIWVKLTGDKGGGTFKMSFQICNINHPNSPANTCIFCIFLAYDSVTNLHIALDKYTEQITDLSAKKWR